MIKRKVSHKALRFILKKYNHNRRRDSVPKIFENRFLQTCGLNTCFEFFYLKTFSNTNFFKNSQILLYQLIDPTVEKSCLGPDSYLSIDLFKACVFRQSTIEYFLSVTASSIFCCQAIGNDQLFEQLPQPDDGRLPDTLYNHMRHCATNFCGVKRIVVVF